MGFKWFKARLTMNRMPEQSSAIAGSYRVMSFDVPRNEFTTNNNHPSSNGHVKSEPISNRPVSMPILNNPMVGIASGNENPEYVPPSYNRSAQKSSTGTREVLELGEENVYNTGVGNPVLSKRHTFQPDSNDNIARTSPKPSPKIKKVDYKKKKGKAPAPKLRLDIINASTSENSSEQFITLKNKKKTSQDSDIDV